MKLERVKEILEAEYEDTFVGSEKEWKNVIRVSIGAIGLVIKERRDLISYAGELLPGETED